MKIILFLNKDLAANLSYNLIKETLASHEVKIYYSATVGKSRRKPKDLLQLEYFEKKFFFTALPAFIKAKKLESDFEFFNDDFSSTPFIRCKKVNSYKFIKEVKAFNPDLFVSVRFGKIFRDDIITVPKLGIINLHSAVLPDYRGILGTLHALKDQQKEIGCTLHTIPNSGIDTGNIIDIARIETKATRSLFWHVVQLYPKGCQLIENTINELAAGQPLGGVAQDLTAGNYFSLPKINDFKQIKKLGFPVLDVQDYIDIINTFVIKKWLPKDKEELSELIQKHMG